MTNVEFLAKEINSRYGNIKRARNCFLYTEKGVRLTDLYQEGGRAILGWGGGSAFTMFKNTLNRGITGSFITTQEQQTVRAVEKLFDSKRKLFYFNTKEVALKSALLLSPDGTAVYRPWNPVPTVWSQQDAIIFAPPLPWSQSIFILAAKPELVEKSFENGELFASNEKIPSPLHSAIARSVYDLIAAIQTREEKNWFIYDKFISEYWKRKGPYLFPKISEENYNDFVIHCLDLGIVVSPEYNVPSIVPFGADEGVFHCLKQNPSKIE